MKLGKVGTVTQMVGFLILIMASTAVRAAQLPDQVPIKDPDGDATLAIITLCNDCKAGDGKGCYTGAEDGWLEGAPCGKCLIESNFRKLLRYPYDLQITGTLVDPQGQPVKDRFVQVFLPNGWTVKGRTSELGTFRLLLGATSDRKGKDPVKTDIGTRVDTKKGDDPYYALFLLPETYNPCPAEAAKPAEAKPKHGAAKKKKK